MAFLKDEQLRGQVEQLRNNFGALEEKQNQLLEHLKILTTQVEEIKQAQIKASQQEQETSSMVQREVHKITTTSEDFDRALRSFKDLQNRVELYSFEKINEGINNSLEKLKQDTEKYTSAKIDINQVLGKMDQLKVELDKFVRVSKNISEADFELREYAKLLTANDHEKLRLMKEIDSLQRLVSSLRRKVRA